MTPKQFVAMQLALPAPKRVIPDRIYMWDIRIDNLRRLKHGYYPYSASDVFTSDFLYERAEYFGPNEPGHLRYYKNGVFDV